jgi:diguanylate cyclase (GGDEF) domain
MVTVSIGIASYPHNANNLFELIVNADKALYSAKKDGRNRVA